MQNARDWASKKLVSLWDRHKFSEVFWVSKKCVSLRNRHKFSEVAGMLGEECSFKCADDGGSSKGREAIKQRFRDQVCRRANPHI